MKRAACLLLALAFAGAAAAEPAALRVCADPDNLPFSHQDGSGFENRLAELLASELGLPLQYAWLPDRRGFVRKTLGAGLCDLIIGVPAGFERTLNTRPYYRSSYMLLRPANGGPALTGFDDPRLRRWRIGVPLVGDDMAATPPGHALARAGAIDNVVGFPLAGETPAASRMVQALLAGELDAGFLWGPQAGWHALRHQPALALQQVAAPADLPSQRFAFAIAMGVRRGDQALRERIDAALQRRQQDVRRILDAYGVPQPDTGPR